MLLNNMMTWNLARENVLRLATLLTTTNYLCMAGTVYLILQFILEEIKLTEYIVIKTNWD